MDDVMEHSQVAFEEDGINQKTLVELREVGRLLLFFFIATIFDQGNLDRYSHPSLSPILLRQFGCL